MWANVTYAVVLASFCRPGTSLAVETLNSLAASARPLESICSGGTQAQALRLTMGMTFMTNKACTAACAVVDEHSVGVKNSDEARHRFSFKSFSRYSLVLSVLIIERDHTKMCVERLL